MTLHADDLSPELRKRLNLSSKTRSRPKPSRAVNLEGSLPMRCHNHGITFAANAETAMKRHNKDTGCGRFEIVFEGASDG